MAADAQECLARCRNSRCHQSGGTVLPEDGGAMTYLAKSPWIIHYDASSCNGCDIEVLAALTPVYDVERFGIVNTGNPKHADVFVPGCAARPEAIIDGVVKALGILEAKRQAMNDRPAAAAKPAGDSV